MTTIVTRSPWLAVCALLLLAMAACGGGSDATTSGDPASDKLAQVLARGTLVGSFEPDYAPQSFAVADAARPAETACGDNQLTAPQVTGYDVEVTKLVAAALEVEACFVSPSWNEVLSGNWEGRWDIAYAGGVITADRMKRLYMTRPYYAGENRYFVAKDSSFREPSNLDGKRIGACGSCSQEAYLRNELVIPGTDVVLDVVNPDIVVFNQGERSGLEAVAKGTIDAFLASDPVGRAAIEGGAPLRALDSSSFNDFGSGFVDRISLLSSAAFVARVDEIVEGLHADGTLEELSLEWLGRDYASGAAEFDVATLEQKIG